MPIKLYLVRTSNVEIYHETKRDGMVNDDVAEA